MNRAHFLAYIPVRDIRKGILEWLDRFDEASRDLEGREFTIPASELLKRAHWSVRREPPSEAVMALFEGHRYLGILPISEFVVIEFSCDRPSSENLEELFQGDERTKEEDRYPYWVSFCLHELEGEVTILNLALDLSVPGSSFYGAYILASEGQVHRPKSGDLQFGDAYKHSVSVGLQPGPNIAFDDAWNFLGRVNGLRDGVPDVPVGKVISALTYLALEADSANRFFRTVWACSGIEGFFASSTTSRQYQSVEKISLFLNQDKEITKRQFSLLYESRSKFIHGNKALSSALIDLSPPEGKVSLDEWDAEYIGSYFLMETARECIRRGIFSQEFVLSMKE